MAEARAQIVIWLRTYEGLAPPGKWGSEHSFGEARFILMGLSYQGRVAVVAHADADDSIRIISARLASRAERKFYEQ